MVIILRRQFLLIMNNGDTKALFLTCCISVFIVEQLLNHGECFVQNNFLYCDFKKVATVKITDKILFLALLDLVCTNSATRRCSNVLTTSICMSQ